MQRDDWVFVGMRVVGLWPLCRSVLGLPDLLECCTLTHHEGVFVALSRSGMAEVILGWTVGVALLLGAPWLDRRLRARDRRSAG